MKIKYYGNSCFLYKSKKSKLITNPKDEGVKINLKRINPDVVVSTHPSEVPDNGYYIIRSAGEYEVKDLFVYGFKSADNSKDIEQADIFMFDIDGIHIGIIDKDVKKVRGDILNEMGIVDVLCVSLRDDVGMKLTHITDLINKIEPYFVIPMDYNEELLRNLGKILGVKDLDEVKDLSIDKADCEVDDVATKIYVLKSS